MKSSDAETSNGGPPLGVAPLCAVTASAEDYVGAAARAGFDFIGIRLAPVTGDDVVYTPQGRAFRELRRLLADTDLEVLDAEVFSVRVETTREDWIPVLEMGAELGISLLNIVGDIEDVGLFSQKAAELTDDARQFSITPVIEPIAYRPLNSYARATGIAREIGCAVELDALHVLRTNADLDVVARNQDLFPILQLCDAPRRVRAWAPRPAQARESDDDMVIESRLHRLLPGRGAAPLAEMRQAVAPGTPVALEVPNLHLQSVYGIDDYFALLHREGQAFVAPMTSSATD